jgi:hypothetical protein
VKAANGARFENCIFCAVVPGLSVVLGKSGRVKS